jgi:hypothetical protein
VSQRRRRVCGLRGTRTDDLIEVGRRAFGHLPMLGGADLPTPAGIRAGDPHAGRLGT